MYPGDKSRLCQSLLLLLFTANLSQAKDEPPGNPAELVSRAIQNEIAANAPGGKHFMFRNQRKTAHLNQTKLIIETRDATAGMLVEVDGHPLPPQQRQAEEARLQNYVHNPDEPNKKHTQEKQAAHTKTRNLSPLPKAFIYEPDGTQPETPTVGCPGDELLRLNFRPDPNYRPPSRVEQVLTGMHGHVLLDTRQNRLA